MDNIYKYAEEFDNDYYDPIKCVIYKVQKYKESKQLGLCTEGIDIVDLDGKLIGYLPEKK